MNTNEQCTYCKKRCELKRCGKCNEVAYCSKECQRTDWTCSHKKVCRDVSVEEKLLMNIARDTVFCVQNKQHFNSVLKAYACYIPVGGAVMCTLSHFDLNTDPYGEDVIKSIVITDREKYLEGKPLYRATLQYLDKIQFEAFSNYHKHKDMFNVLVRSTLLNVRFTHNIGLPVKESEEVCEIFDESINFEDYEVDGKLTVITDGENYCSIVSDNKAPFPITIIS